jgi:hypothetical protein
MKPPALTSDQTCVLLGLRNGAEDGDLPDWMVEDCMALGVIEEARPGFYRITDLGRSALAAETSREPGKAGERSL